MTVDCPDEKVQALLLDFYSQALGGDVVSGCLRASGWLFIFEVIVKRRV